MPRNLDLPGFNNPAGLDEDHKHDGKKYMEKVIHVDPGILDGTPVFPGTRAPVKIFLIIWKQEKQWMIS
jgi:hypothetical protein